MELHSVKNDAGLRLRNFQKNKQSNKQVTVRQDYFRFTVTFVLLFFYFYHTTFFEERYTVAEYLVIFKRFEEMVSDTKLS